MASSMSTASEQDSKETSEKFFRFFQSEAAALRQQMDRLADTALVGGERIDATEHCLAGITRLSNEVRDASAYIPARDQRTYSESIRGLQDRFQETRAAFAAKPKFSFKTPRKRPSAISLSDAAQLASQQRLQVPGYGNSENPSSNESSVAPTPQHLRTPPNEPQSGNVGDLTVKDDTDPGQEDEWAPNEDDISALQLQREVTIRKPSFSQSSSVAISRQSGAHIILPASAARVTTTTGSLSNLRRCIVDMSAPTATGAGTGAARPFAGLTLKNIRDSLVVCGRVGGPAHVTRLERAVVVVACRQFRMHDCKDCDVYLQVTSRPIIENCERVRFAPLPECYVTESEKLVENQWDQVDDFKWLKPEPSPNWKTLPVEERVNLKVWSEVVPGGPGHGLGDILAAVGVGKRG